MSHEYLWRQKFLVTPTVTPPAPLAPPGYKVYHYTTYSCVSAVFAIVLHPSEVDHRNTREPQSGWFCLLMWLSVRKCSFSLSQSSLFSHASCPGRRCKEELFPHWEMTTCCSGQDFLSNYKFFTKLKYTLPKFWRHNKASLGELIALESLNKHQQGWTRGVWYWASAKKMAPGCDN